jgi:hypothetical protein
MLENISTTNADDDHTEWGARNASASRVMQSAGISEETVASTDVF